MKKYIIVLLLILFYSILYSQEVSILAVDAQPFIKDENNLLRYMPLNIFDNDSSTVYAKSSGSYDKEKPLLQIYFGNKIKTDSIKIKNGYFDKLYYFKNLRIKTGYISIYNNASLLNKQVFTLNDNMVMQTIKFEKTYEITKIQIYVDSFYPSEKWNDIVISDLFFSLDNQDYTVIYGLRENVYNSYIEDRKYSITGKIEYKKEDYVKFFSFEYKYIYDSRDRLLSKFKSGGDGPGGSVTVYEYDSLDNQFPNVIYQYDVYDFDKDVSKIVNPYKIDNNGLLLTKHDFDGIYHYVYEKNQLLNEIIDEGNNRVKKVYYQNGKCIASDEGNWFYVIIYDKKGFQKYKIPVYTNNSECVFYEYEYYENGLIKKINGWTYSSFN